MRLAFCIESAIFGYGWRDLVGLEEHLLDVFVRHAKKLLQHLVFGRVELPQIVSPSLTWKDPVDEHDLDHGDKIVLLAYHILDAGLKSGQLHR